MDARLQEMLDHYEITRTLKDYCHGCDRGDEPMMAGVYRDDSWDDHGHRKATGPEFARIMTAEIRATTESIAHLLGQSTIKVDGDAAGAETYFIAVMHDRRADGTRMCNQLGGRFVDRLRREDGRWRIAHRVVVRDWSVSLPVTQDWTAEAGLIDGQRSDGDPALAALGRAHGGWSGAAHA